MPKVPSRVLSAHIPKSSFLHSSSTFSQIVTGDNMTIFILKPGGTLLLMEKKNDLIWQNYFYLGFLSLSLPEFLSLSLSGTLGLSNFLLK